MCTAISYLSGDHYFGRNLDLEYSYEESVAITPRNYPFFFADGEELRSHYAMIGMAYVADGYPLYYDGINEKGLAMASLAFPHEAVYHEKKKDKRNISPAELIPYILGKCQNVSEAKQLLETLNLWNHPFSAELPLTPLHFLISDKKESLTAEPTEKGLLLYENPVGVLTNSPNFDFQMQYLNLFMGLSADPIENRFSDEIPFKAFSRGMGALGLPGDLSSTSRFVRAVFTKSHMLKGNTEKANVSQFFHILGSVEQQKGCVHLDGKYEYTIYSCCCNTDKGIYYYTTYDDRAIIRADMHDADLDGDELVICSQLQK
ncbi:MAG: choloylglycine hydrolase [Clostridia bacterium]|nr:choloylglycine hydrolase [Clostridia bacterium]